MKFTVRPLKRSPNPTQRGRTLLELMVALIIGMVILGGVLLNSVSTSGAHTEHNTTSLLNEEAQIAANILNWQLRVAGYTEIVAVPRPRLQGQDYYEFRNYGGPPIRGCDGRLNDTSAAMSDMGCSGNGPDSFTVAYEANTWSTLPTNDKPNLGTDCLGRAIETQTPSEGDVNRTFTLAENTFFINANNELACAGSGNKANSQPLLANVADMQVKYGVSAVPVLQPGSTTPVQPLYEPIRYLTATQVEQMDVFPPGSTLPAFRERWNRVVSVRICLTLRTANEIHSKPRSYVGCDGESVVPADKRAYRTVTVNTAIKNRTAPCADPAAAPGQPRAAADRCA